MKYHIYTALFYVLPVGHVCAAGLERSNQSIQAFFEKGNYAEVSVLQVNPNVSGKVQPVSSLGNPEFSTGDMVNKQHYFQAALKLQPHPQVSVALLFDQPFFTDVDYQFNTTHPSSEIADVEFDSNNMTALVGYQPNANWNLFTGVSYQSFSGNLRIGTHVENFYVDYAVHFPKDHAWGWLVGVSYQLPEYAFTTAITYRSKIKHHTNASESFWGFPLEIAPQHATTIQTPESINLDFQTGLPAQNFLYASLRWVNWQDFEIQPTQYAAMLQQVPNMNLNLIDYQKNQWSVRLGVAHQWSPKWITAVEGLWDSGAGNPASSFNPVDGYLGLGTGLIYNFTPKTFVISGIHYLYFNQPKNAQGSSFLSQNSHFSQLEERDAWIYHLKLAHRF
ncbi:outer membrane protein transport protein [Acinetobacter sp. YH16058]|uniref:outer membrane protein transport protein n=1 Tax=Acinetobacter sp. YH16058 TaxID=2601196 RepID=UPI0015D34435|nr:outer membrane protein transport protein [Acinetobacter sp. YH16058]